METRIATGRCSTTVYRRASFCFIGALAIVATGCFLGPRPAWAQMEDILSSNFNIRHGKVPAGQRTLRVTEGTRVELRWTTDEAVELHLHGYDIKIELTPGTSASMIFDVDVTGRFPVEIHGTDGHAHGNIIYLEVHPR